jgi:NarL family two-component system response regulator LiaR
VVSLMRVLNAVANGEAAIPRHLSRAIIRALQQATPASGSADAGLSERQREVLLLIADGLTDREISRQLSISLPTVRSHVEAIFQKTSTTNRTAAARWAHHYVSRLNGAHDDQPVHDSERSLTGAS